MHNRRQALSRTAAAAVVALTARPALAQYEAPTGTYNPPAGYYDTATGTGATLKANLNDIIDNDTTQDYDDARFNLDEIDYDPSTPGNLLLFYSGHSVSGVWDSGVTWNREHVWPDSYGIEGSGHDYGDLFNLRPCDPSVNSDRSNEYYANISVAQRMDANTDPAPGGTPGNYENNTLADNHINQHWEPRAIDKGDIARTMFYMATRYDGVASGTTDLELTDTVGSITSSNSLMGLKTRFLEWHYQDGISNAERRRNDVIHDNYQDNRNPFIDHPEYVWTIFGTGNNNSQVYAGNTVNSGTGVSTPTVTTRVMKNAAMTASDVTLTKLNAHPTTYDITASGNVVTTAAGPGQTFDYNTQQRIISVALNDSTATTGLKTGTVTIDNTDLTSAVAGQGSADGNDIITVQAQVVDNRVITATAVPFGKVIYNTALPTVNTSLNSPGDDNNWTRVVVTGAAVGPNGDGVSITTGTNRTYNGTITTGTRALGATFGTVGAKSGSLNFVLANGESAISGTPTLVPVSVSYTATAVTHSEGSLASPTDTNAQTLDFGYVPVGFLRSNGFAVHNLETNPGFTASLDIDSVTPGGDAAQFTNTVAPTGGSPILGGAQGNYSVDSTLSTSGVLNATWTMGVSDENIPGFTSGTNLVVTAAGRFISTGDFPVTGTLALLGAENWSTGAAAIGSGATLTKSGTGTLNINGAQTHASNATLNVTGGIVNFTTDGGTSLGLTSTAGTTNLNATQHLRDLTVNGGQVNANASSNIVTDAFTHTAGKLDLVNNKMIVRSGNESTIAAKVAAGRSGGTWTGSGIITSMTDALGASALTSLAVAAAGDVGKTTFAGESVAPADVLVMYTYGGDANFSGTLDADDYFAIDSGYSQGASEWSKGDFNYSNNIDGDDYFILDANFTIGGPPIPSLPEFGAVSAVPEPVIGSFLALGALALRRRTRRA